MRSGPEVGQTLRDKMLRWEYEAVRRCSIGGASPEETADLMGVTVPTVRRYVKRYRQEEES
jgi:DNA-directed RNA polymerase specialized sigma24 family protein